MIKNNINFIKLNNKEILDTPPNPTVYSGEMYGLDTMLTGRDVKIAIIDSGTPSHSIIKTFKDAVNFCENCISIEDANGHSTMMSGIIAAHDPNTVRGFAPNSQLFYAKVIDDKKECVFNSLVASVLWAIVKEVDIILMSLGTQTKYSVLHDAIKKAYDNHICVIAATPHASKEVSFPACCDEVLAVSSSYRASKTKNGPVLHIESKDLNTTFLNNKFIIASGSSLAAATVAGLTANIIEEKYRKNDKIEVSSIYKQLFSLKIAK